MQTNNKIFITKAKDVSQFNYEVDVIVCGYGGAGGCAALESFRSGAKTLVLERLEVGQLPYQVAREELRCKLLVVLRTLLKT